MKLEIVSQTCPGRVSRLGNRVFPEVLSVEPVEKKPEVVSEGKGFLGYSGPKRSFPENTGSEIIFAGDEPVPLWVGRGIAEFSVEKTVEYAEKFASKKRVFGAFVHGSSFPDLRALCAQKLSRLSPTVLAVGNAKDLLKNPRLLVETIVAVKKSISPNTLLYFPDAGIRSIPLLAYMGVDVFDARQVVRMSRDEKVFSDTLVFETQKTGLPGGKGMVFAKLLAFNFSKAREVAWSVRSAIKNGEISQLAETFCTASPRLLSALRILYREHYEFLEEYAPTSL